MPVQIKHQFIRQPGGVLFVIAATICWSTSGIFISWIIDNNTVTPIGLAFWRDLVTSLCLGGILATFRPSLLRIKRRDLPWLFAMGAVSIGFFHVMWNTAVVTIGASLATVLQSNAPIFVTISAWLLWKEPLSRKKIVSIVLAVVGTVLITGVFFSPTLKLSTVGGIVGVSMALAYSTLSLIGKKLSANYNPWTILFYVFGFASLTLAPFQFFFPFPGSLTLLAVSSFAGLVVITTILGFGLFTLGLGKIQASVASITALTEVPFAAVLAYFFLGERLGGWQLLGSLLVVSGVVLLSVPTMSPTPK